MKKIIGFGIIILVLTSCQYSNQLKNDKHLTDRIEKELKSSNREIDFSQFDDFDWDKLIILRPYSTIENVEKELNLNLRNIRQNGIEFSDSFSLIVFLKDNKSIKIVELKKVMSPTKTIITKKESQFITDNDGILKLNE